MKQLIHDAPVAVLVLLLLAGAACSGPADRPSVPIDAFAHIADVQVRDLLANAIQQAGGIDRWQSKAMLKFDKKTVLYHADGSVELASDQQHTYTYGASEDIEISWSKDGQHHQLSSIDGMVTKLVDQVPDTTISPSAATNTVLSAVYVISLPFKLLHPQINLTYEGIDTLGAGQEAHVLRAQYQPAETTSYDTEDIWWHYYRTDDHTQIGYKVQHADHISYVANLAFTRANGILFPTERKSWRMNEDGSLSYLRAAYAYSNYQVE